MNNNGITARWPHLLAGFMLLIVAGLLIYSPDAPAEGALESPVPDDALLFERRIEIISMSCAACHGTDGRLRTAIPALAGRPAPILHAQLVAFQNDAMPGATVMPRIARGFSEDELKAIADYFAALQP